jgi:hypothetical protein
MKKGMLKETLKDPNVKMGIGLGMFFTSIISAVVAGKKNTLRKQEKEAEKGEPLTVLEKVKNDAPRLIGVAALAAGGTYMVTSAFGDVTKENAKLAATCGFLEATLSKYSEKVVETVGENKANKVKDAIAKEKMSEVTDEDIANAIRTGNGDTLFMDGLTGQLFYSDWETVRSAANDISHMLLGEMWLDANTLLEEWGLKRCKAGEMLGFNVDDGLIELYKTSDLVGSRHDIPCCVIQYDVRSDYSSDSRVYSRY